MTVSVYHRNNCRLCESGNVELVVKLEPIPLAEFYTETSEQAHVANLYPIDLYMCNDCGHVQQLDVIDSKSLWDDYTYFSGMAPGMPEHFQSVADKAINTYGLPENALVIDIGSNDGSLLKPFKNAGYRVLGIDPAKEIAEQATKSGIETIPELMSIELANKIVEEHGKAHVVCVFNAFAHADNLGDMAEAARILLSDDGIFIFEVQYLLDVIDRVLLATIFHEHMSHHSFIPMMNFLNTHDLEIIDVARVAIQHGSLIGFAQVKGGDRKIQKSVNELVNLEQKRELNKNSTLKEFANKISELKNTVLKLVKDWQKSGITVAGYGAARSGPTLISQLGLDGAIEFIVDDHPQKVGKYSPGHGIQILPTAELLKRMPEYTVILAWVHAEKIIENNQEYLAKGGHFVVLCPEVRIVDKNGSNKL